MPLMLSALSLSLQALWGTARIQKLSAAEAWSAATTMSYRWPGEAVSTQRGTATHDPPDGDGDGDGDSPMPMLSTVVLKGAMGTRSLAMTVMVWLSMLNLKCESMAALTTRIRYDVPDVKATANRDPVWSLDPSS